MSNGGEFELSQEVLAALPADPYEQLGWKLSWAWQTKEVVWSMLGAQTTVQGDCSAFHTDPLPHCCDKRPVVIDLLPPAPQSMQVSNCCTGGVLPSFGQDADNALAAFQVTVGQADSTNTTVKLPQNFTLLTPSGPGYTCSPALQVEKSKFADADGRRFTEAFSKLASKRERCPLLCCFLCC